MKLAVFAGPKQSGKDTSAKILKDSKRAVGNVPFAGPLKRICAEVFQIAPVMFNDPDFKERPFKEPVVVNIKHLRKLKELMLEYVDPYEPGKFHNLNRIPASQFEGLTFKTPREILQIIGTELIRECVHQDWHCWAAFSEKNKKISGFSNSTHCVTDCRFPNEYLYLKKHHDCTFAYVERPEAEKVLAEATHDSERLLLQVKEMILADGGVLIKNHSSVEDLKKIVETLELPAPTKAKGKKGKFVFRNSAGEEIRS